MIDADAFCVVRQAAGGIETGEKVHVAHIAFALQIGFVQQMQHKFSRLLCKIV